MTHNERVLDVLKDGEWHNTIAIINKHFPGRYQVAIRSRVSDIRIKHGIKIDSRMGDNGLAEFRLTPSGTDEKYMKHSPRYNCDTEGQLSFV